MDIEDYPSSLLIYFLHLYLYLYKNKSSNNKGSQSLVQHVECLTDPSEDDVEE